MSVSDVLIELQLRAPEFIAGASGGLVRAIMLKKKDEPWSLRDLGNACTSMLVGSLAARYLSGPISHFFGDLDRGTTGFLVGMAGVVLCQVLVDQVVSRFGLTPTDKP